VSSHERRRRRSLHELVDVDLGRPRSRTDEAFAEREARIRSLIQE
jgi:hypothetical protein